MEKRVYKNYFTVPANYTANMTREAINQTPDTWLEFYPHVKYLDFLKTLFDENKSVWLTGNYGTGKSNAALVTHKLFMDDMSRVESWFEEYRANIVNCDSLKKQLVEARESGILVVYDYNASGIGPDEEFLVRLEKGILSALKEHNYIAPAKANLDLVIERVKREGENFFKTRDSMINEMRSLKADIRTVDQLVAKLRSEETGAVPSHYLDDVQAVLHRDNIYLSVDVPTFRAWIASICQVNGLKRIIYIFDEFSDFIDSNSGTLKTFEDVTEAPAVNHFYLVPVTHKELSAFHGENTPGANKAKDRFYFRNLQMPNDIAFRLAAHAMKPVEAEPYKSEWKNEKDALWNSISTVVDKFNDPENSEAYVARQSFYDILPIQPMAAFLLKFLAESARSNQRSIFEYLKGSADGREFQDFISKGGPRITNRQFLTVDYLWKYFMEREDSGQAKEITAIKMEYDRIKAREFANYDDEQPEIRVLKTVMLFALLSRLNPNGHDRLRPTVENIQLSFRGDGAIVDVDNYLRDLSENRHCFSIVNGTIDLYSTTVGNSELGEKKQELSGQFHELLSETCKKKMEEYTKSARSAFSGDRFDIRVSDLGHTTLANITSSTRDKYSTGIAKDDGSVCLWFIVAKNKAEQLLVSQKQESLLQNLRTHRIIMLSFPEVTFCEKNVNLWDEYVTLRAQHLLENNSTAKDQIQKSIIRIEKEWTDSLRTTSTVIDVKYYDDDSEQIVSRKSSWADLKSFLPFYVKKKMDCCPDIITDQITVFGNKALKAWALAGIRFNGTSPQGQLINFLKNQGINATNEWFSGNPDHLFSKIRAMLEKKYDNTVARGTNLSLRKVYIELKRAPYGMRYNCLSAFTLGFCLSWVLDKNCQWTNGQLNYPLDEDTLAEIIEATVSEKTEKEKFVCRLSKEDKAFAEKACCMFGMDKVEDSTPITTLGLISNRVETTSNKVPLWVLADYIRTKNPEHENVATLLDTLCTALKTSSKGNTEGRTAAIGEIGSAIINTPEIIAIANEYTQPANYVLAFRQYVDKADPNLAILAEKIEDQSHEYCDLILEKARGTSGWLWNQSDISALIEQVNCTYRAMGLVYTFLNINGHTTYNELMNRLVGKMCGSGFPYSIVGTRYPSVETLARELMGDKKPETILTAFQESIDILDSLYNDPQQKLAISIIKDLLGNVKIDDNNLRSILMDMSGKQEYSFGMATENYVKLINKLILENVRNALVRKNIDECRRICGFEDVYSWSKESRLPAWTLFNDIENGSELVQVLASPNNYTNEVLEQKYELLKIIPEVDIKHCQDVFFEKTVPDKYKKLDISLSSLLQYLSEAFGPNPNNWPKQPDITKFINGQYKEVIAPNVVSKIKTVSAEDLKEKILLLAKEDPDIGLKFLEL